MEESLDSGNPVENPAAGGGLLITPDELRAAQRLMRLAEYEGLPVFRVAEAVAIDYDRTVGDVNNAILRFNSTARLNNIGTDKIEAAQAKTEKDGGTFEPLSFVASHFTDTDSGRLDQAGYDRFCWQFVHADGPPLLYPDAVRFLDRLQEAGKPHFFFTWGVNKEWQRLKIMASGYPAYVDLMDNSDKGQEITDLADPDDGKYYFRRMVGGPGLFIADNICAVEDKPDALQNLPKGSHGYIIRRGELLPSQLGEIPPNVGVINSLDELQDDQDGRLQTVTVTSPLREATHYPARFAMYAPLFPGDNRPDTDAVYRLQLKR
jgi:hypothetical protein